MNNYFISLSLNLQLLNVYFLEWFSWTYYYVQWPYSVTLAVSIQDTLDSSERLKLMESDNNEVVHAKKYIPLSAKHPMQ